MRPRSSPPSSTNSPPTSASIRTACTRPESQTVARLAPTRVHPRRPHHGSCSGGPAPDLHLPEPHADAHPHLPWTGRSVRPLRRRPREGLPPIEQLAGDIATRNGCAAAAPAVTTVAPGIDELIWSGCAAPTSSTESRPKVMRGPGGTRRPTPSGLCGPAPTSKRCPGRPTPTQAPANVYLSNPGIDASEEMWEFFTSQG